MSTRTKVIIGIVLLLVVIAYLVNMTIKKGPNPILTGNPGYDYYGAETPYDVGGKILEDTSRINNQGEFHTTVRMPGM